jgi:invasion protein IalB
MKYRTRSISLVAMIILLISSSAHAINDPKDPNKSSISNKTAQGDNKSTQNQPSAPTSPVRTETTSFDNWVVSCRETTDGKSKKVCSTTFQLIEKERRSILLSWIIGRGPDGNLISFIQVPTGLLIEKGIELKLGNDGVTRKMNFITCEPTRCEASLQMDNSMTQELSNAQKATATVISIDGRIAKFELNIKGIDKALAGLAQ